MFDDQFSSPKIFLRRKLSINPLSDFQCCPHECWIEH